MRAPRDPFGLCPDPEVVITRVDPDGPVYAWRCKSTGEMISLAGVTTTASPPVSILVLGQGFSRNFGQRGTGLEFMVAGSALFGVPNSFGSYGTTLRLFGPDGWAKTDFDWHPPHGNQTYPHATDWDRTPTGVERSKDWRPVRPGELSSPWPARESYLRSLLGALMGLLRSGSTVSVPFFMVDPCAAQVVALCPPSA